MTNLLKKTFVSTAAILSVCASAFVIAPQANAAPHEIVSPLANKSYEYGTEFGVQCMPAIKGTINHQSQELIATNGTLIKSIADGTVVKITQASGDSVAAEIVVEHEIEGEKHYSVYKNMWEPEKYVKLGSVVSAGQTIAEVGGSGAVAKPHLELEIWQTAYGENGKLINPTTFLKNHNIDLKTSATKISTVKTPQTCSYYTTANVNLREKPDSNSKIIATIPKQSLITSEPKVENENGDYIKVAYDKKVGWLSKTHVSPEYDNSRKDAVKLAVSASYGTTAESRVSADDLYGVKKAKPEYITAKKQAMSTTSNDPMPTLYASCDRFVSTVSRLTMDTKLPWGSTVHQQQYLSNSPQWKRYTKKSEAKPGDIFVTKKGGHVVIYLGQVNGVESIAHASYLSRVAAIQSATYLNEDLVDRSGREYYGFSYIGKQAPKPTTVKYSTITANQKYSVKSTLNFRNGPSSNNGVIQKLSKGTIVITTGRASGTWYEVKVGSKTGWVSSSYLQKVVVNTTAKTTLKTKTTTTNVNMRAGAGTNYKIVQTVKKGTKVSLTGKQSGKWTQVKVGTKTGWIHSSYLK